jgi:UDP-3-O-[3-hydroxymyristoyl] glucosamine N-acyltransferase
MSDPVFFAPLGPLSLASIIAMTDAVAAGAIDPARIFCDVAALDQAGARSVALFDDRDSLEALAQTRAGACFVAQRHRSQLPERTIGLVTEAPRRAFARLVAAFYPHGSRPTSLFATRGISPAAFIHSDARLEAEVIVDPGVVIGPKAEIGAGTVVGANSVIGPHVRIGRGCAIGANVTIAHALIGNAVVIHAGVRIGQDGWSASGGSEADVAITGLGRVIIQDGVEIGANATIDRGGLRDTIVGEGSRLDNLVHVPRDRTIARYAILQAGRPVSEA